MRNVLLPRLTFLLILAFPVSLAAQGGIESSYHGQMGRGTGLGMLEKWCALPNFSFEEQGGIYGWTAQPCNECHIGAAWNPTKPTADCLTCHTAESPDGSPTVAACVTCHKKDTEKRGDSFTAAADVHIASGMRCQDCHARLPDGKGSYTHQFAKGSIIDTTEPTAKGTLACIPCHLAQPHTNVVDRGAEIDKHLGKVACETCHTGPRPEWALASRRWDAFTTAGTPLSVKRVAGWMPTYKWYDGKGPGASGEYHLSILGAAERRNSPGAKIYPFNPITITWYIKSKKSKLTDFIAVPTVKFADANGDGVTTPDEMRIIYPQATLVTRDLNFNISHSIRPASEAFACADCHGSTGWVLNWKGLGYKKDPSPVF
jgi:methanogenesis multiheme c-type cytochrome